MNSSLVTISVVCLLVCAAYAADTNPATTGNNGALAESLIKRGEALISHTNQLLKEYRNHTLDHLINAVEHEVALVEALVFELKAEHAKQNTAAYAIHKIHLIEEQLLHLENRVSEELVIVEEARHHVHLNRTAEQLILHARTLVETARQVVVNFDNAANHKEVASIEHEIHLIQQLIVQLEKKPTGEELRREEQQLVRNQQTLLNLIERIKVHEDAGKHTSNPKHDSTEVPEPNKTN